MRHFFGARANDGLINSFRYLGFILQRNPDLVTFDVCEMGDGDSWAQRLMLHGKARKPEVGSATGKPWSPGSLWTPATRTGVPTLTCNSGSWAASVLGRGVCDATRTAA